MIERFFIFDGGESKIVLDEKIEEKLDQILKDKFKCSEEKMKTIKENGVRLLSNKIGFSSVNLFELFLEIEREFGISFSEEELLNFEFDKYGELLEMIKGKLGGL